MSPVVEALNCAGLATHAGRGVADDELADGRWPVDTGDRRGRGHTGPTPTQAVGIAGRRVAPAPQAAIAVERADGCGAGSEVDDVAEPGDHVRWDGPAERSWASLSGVVVGPARDAARATEGAPMRASRGIRRVVFVAVRRGVIVGVEIGAGGLGRIVVAVLDEPLQHTSVMTAESMQIMDHGCGAIGALVVVVVLAPGAVSHGPVHFDGHGVYDRRVGLGAAARRVRRG